MSMLLALLLYFVMKFFYKYMSVSIADKQSYNTTFSNSLAKSFFYTISLIILFFMFSLILRNLLNFGKFKYLFGFLIAATFIILFKAINGTLDWTDNITKIEVAIVTLFGFLIAKRICIFRKAD